MARVQTSIKLPSQTSIRKRLKGLREIQKRVINGQPQPWWGPLTWKGSNLAYVGCGKSNTPEGIKWTEMNQAVSMLIKETEDTLTFLQRHAKVAKSKKTAEVANG
jgi:hypothetical protein